MLLFFILMEVQKNNQVSLANTVWVA